MVFFPLNVQCVACDKLGRVGMGVSGGMCVDKLQCVTCTSIVDTRYEGCTGVRQVCGEMYGAGKTQVWQRVIVIIIMDTKKVCNTQHDISVLQKMKLKAIK